MAGALTAGEQDLAVLAPLARRAMRKKIPGLQMACDGRDHLTAKIAELDQLMANATAPFERLMTIPGIGQRTPQVIVAETGGDMSRFRTSARLAA
jgi:transposase